MMKLDRLANGRQSRIVTDRGGPLRTHRASGPMGGDIVAANGQSEIFRVLRARFGPVPPEWEAAVNLLRDELVLAAAIELAASRPDLGRFGAELRAIPRPPEPWDSTDEPELKA